MVENVDRIRHYCKICKRGFMCGGALGGHMRAHAAGDHVNVRINDDEEHPMDKQRQGNKLKRTYFLRTSATNRFMSTTCRARQDCDKNILTLNSLSPDIDAAGGRQCVWLNAKRPRSPAKMENCDENASSSSEEDEDLANCLVMLSNGRKLDPMVAVINDANKEMMMMKGQVFQCKACNKVFNSHQALGGHRASHKKVKGCFAARFMCDHDHDHDQEFSTAADPRLDLNQTLDDAPLGTDHLKRKSKVHECSVCHRVFSSGQALGGHKRCHWLTSDTSSSSIPKFHELQYNTGPQLYEKPMLKKSEPLDLNHQPLAADDQAFEVPTRIYLMPRANEYMSNNTYGKRKMVKLSNLRDMNLDGGSSTWLQVGIAPTTHDHDHGRATP